MVSEASVKKAFMNIDDEISEIMAFSEEVEGKTLEGTADSRVKLIKHVRKFHHDREDLFKQMKHMRAKENAQQNKENKAEEELYKLLQKTVISYEELADKLELSFEKFLKVYNMHVAYVYSYPGFTTLYTHIGKRLKIFKAVEDFMRGELSKGKVSKENINTLMAEFEILRQRYHDLEQGLKMLDRMFADFNNLQRVIYNKTSELDLLKDKYERASGLAGFFGRKKLVKRGVDIDKVSTGALESSVKTGRIKLSRDDEARVNTIIKASKSLHKVKVPVIRERSSILRKDLNHIFGHEKNSWHILDKAAEQLKKSRKRSKISKAA